MKTTMTAANAPKTHTDGYGILTRLSAAQRKQYADGYNAYYTPNYSLPVTAWQRTGYAAAQNDDHNSM